MPGLRNALPPKPAAAPVAAAPNAGPRAPAASPADQQDYNQFVANGMRAIYDKKGLPSLMKSLDGNGNPMEGLMNTLALVVTRVVGSAKQAGKSLPPNVVLHGAGELLEQLADLSGQSGGHKYTDQELATISRAVVAGTMQQKNSAPPAAAPPEPPPDQPPDDAAAPPPAMTQPPPQPMRRGLMA